MVVMYHANWPLMFRQILLWYLIYVNVPYTAANRCDAKPFGSVLAGTSSPTSMFDVVYPGGLALCARECKYRRRCKSFNYVDATDECQLNEEIITGSGENTTGVFYSNIDTWPESIAGVCANVFCSAFEKCAPSAVGGQCKTIYYNVTTADNTTLLGYVFDAVTASSNVTCAEACYARAACVSFNYRNVDNRCELNSKTMITDYLSYIGNKPGTIYRNIHEYSQSMTGVCSTQPCDDYSVCEDIGGIHNCTIKYCEIPTAPYSDAHVILELNQSINLWPINTNLPYRCQTFYYPNTYWVCDSRGYWIDPECKNIRSCSDLRNKCNEDYSVSNGTYILKVHETENDMIINCYTHSTSTFLRIPQNSTYSYYSTQDKDGCHDQEFTCKLRTFFAIQIYIGRTFIAFYDALDFSTTDCDGPLLLRAGKNCDAECSESGNGAFHFDIRGSGLKIKYMNFSTGDIVFAFDNQTVTGSCSDCNTICKPVDVYRLLPAEGTDINYSDSIVPSCLAKG